MIADVELGEAVFEKVGGGTQDACATSLQRPGCSTPPTQHAQQMDAVTLVAHGVQSKPCAATTWSSKTATRRVARGRMGTDASVVLRRLGTAGTVRIRDVERANSTAVAAADSGRDETAMLPAARGGETDNRRAWTHGTRQCDGLQVPRRRDAHSGHTPKYAQRQLSQSARRAQRRCWARAFGAIWAALSLSRGPHGSPAHRSPEHSARMALHQWHRERVVSLATHRE